MSYRTHPGLHEPEPPRPSIDWSDCYNMILLSNSPPSGVVWEHAEWTRRHALEIERRAYESSKSVKRPLIGPAKAIKR